ncbi:hypothetical protein WR25_03070 [Diploscapter pachys]|uniref:Uncharacterized protein n=1 Tax=Diploscapter pachys TaxID=2018661 RepID=A0A2A2KBT6_9BILA|nr:hypothetical protein WR25_03070 [Diploscapter pachys]
MSANPSSDAENLLVERQNSFKNFDERYMCWCKSVHVVKGAKIIGIICTIIHAISIYEAIRSTADQNFFDFFSGIETVMSFIEFPLAVLLLVGIFKEKPLFMIPFMVTSVFWILIYAIQLLLYILTIFFPGSFMNARTEEHILAVTFTLHPQLDPGRVLENRGSEEKHGSIRLMAFLLVLLYGGLILTGYWFLDVVYKCYRYFNDKNRHNQSNNRLYPMNEA